MFGRSGLLPPVGSAAQLASTRPDFPRSKATPVPVSDSPQHPRIRRERATARPAHVRAATRPAPVRASPPPAHVLAATRDARGRDDDRAAARVERLAQQSWVEGAEPEL